MERNHELLMLLVLFISLRLSLLLISRPQGYLFGASDYDFYIQFGQLSDEGLYPMLHYWTEYPPVFPWMAVAAYKATLAVPTWHGSPIFWFRMVLGSITLLFDLGNLILVYWLGRALHGPSTGLRIAWSYALLFPPLHVWLAWFDTVTLFFLLLAVALALKARGSSAATVAGFGFMVKVFPILVLPLLLKAERGLQSWIRLIAAASLAILAVAAPFLLSAPQYLLASFRSMASRSPWETPWALAEEYFGYGQVAPLPDRVDPSTAELPAYPTDLPWPAITAGFALLYLLLWTRRFDPRRGASAVAFVGLTVNLFLLYSKGYSPQFLVYVVPFAILALPLFRAVGYLATLGAINLLEFPVYGTLFPDQHWMLRDLVILRTALLLLMSWDYLATLQVLPSLQRVRQLAASGAMLAFALWAALMLPAATQEWARTSLDRHPSAALVDYLLANAGSDAAVVFTEQWLYREMYPYLHEHTNLFLIDPVRKRSAGQGSVADGSGQSAEADLSDQLASLSSRYREIFQVRHLDDFEGRRLDLLLAYEARFQTFRWTKELSVSRWTTGRQGSAMSDG